VQALDGLGEVANDLVFRRFRHVIDLTRYRRVFAPTG
jgi:hypothetical protein